MRKYLFFAAISVFGAAIVLLIFVRCVYNEGYSNRNTLEDRVYPVVEEMNDYYRKDDIRNYTRKQHELLDWAFSHPEEPVSRAIVYLNPGCCGPVPEPDTERYKYYMDSLQQSFDFLNKHFPDSPEAESMKRGFLIVQSRLGLIAEPDYPKEAKLAWAKRMDESGLLPFYKKYLQRSLSFHEIASRSMSLEELSKKSGSN